MYGSEFTYSTGIEQAAALFHSLIQNHAFEDGNKRTTVTSCLYVLDRCGYWRGVGLLTDRGGRQLEELALIVATRGTHLKRRIPPHPSHVHLPEIAHALAHPPRAP